MVFSLRRNSRTFKRVHKDELLDMCRHIQQDQLNLSRHLRRDIGVDCGCLPAGKVPFR